MRISILMSLVLFFSLSAHAQLDRIITIKLKWSNAFLIRGEKNILVDTGSRGDWDSLIKQLSTYGITPEKLDLVVLTHGHSDHSGLAARLLASGVQAVAGGKGDLAMMAGGHNDELKPTNLTAFFMKAIGLIDPTFEPFFPNIIIDSELPLGPWGQDGMLIQLPGHTAGSVVLMLRDGTAFVGDMILGGFFGGALFPSKPGEHYYHANRELNRINIEKLLSSGMKTFYLGHGGPVSADDVRKAFDIR